jgi:uncharacterized OB-fold protein
MTIFEDELKRNNFICSECPKCDRLVWPPSEFCNKCLGSVIWRPLSREAVLIEYSSKDGKRFGMAEFENAIRVFGTIEGSSALNQGQSLVLKHCDFDKKPIFIFQIN